MIKRCMEISRGPARLSVRDGQLIIKRDGMEAAQVSFEDLGFLIVDHPGVTYTHRVLSELASHNIALIVCGANHHPVGLILPSEGHSVHGETVSMQSRATERLKDRLWKEIVKGKIMNQAVSLELAGKEGGGLRDLTSTVRTGDVGNLEARAARRYWPLLFCRAFRRDRYGVTPNGLLNYGYAILRAATARALCGAGLHPALGLHHKNRYNAFALADDMMEPFRPMVDRVVYSLWSVDKTTALGSAEKKALLGVLSTSVICRGQSSPLMIALERSAVSLREVISGRAKGLCLPGFADIENNGTRGGES